MMRCENPRVKTTSLKQGPCILEPTISPREAYRTFLRFI